MEEKKRADQLVEGGMVNVKEAARFLQISLAGIYALMGRGELEYAKIGRSRRIPKNALIELAARNLVQRRN